VFIRASPPLSEIPERFTADGAAYSFGEVLPLIAGSSFFPEFRAPCGPFA